MTSVLPRHGARQVMQYLRSGEWKSLRQIPVPVSETIIAGMVSKGWVERRMSAGQLEIKLTQTGLDALRAPIP